MAGSVHGSDRPCKKFRASHIIDTGRHDHTYSRDRLDRMRDEFITHYRKQTAKLTDQENRILAKQLLDSFQFMLDMGK